MSPDVPRLRASDADRASVVEVLEQAHQQGRLGDDEYEDRRRSAETSTYVDELPDLVGDLPEGLALQNDLEVRSGRGIALYPGATAAAVSDGAADLGPSGGVVQDVAIMSGKDMVVEPGTRRLQIHSFMGGHELDFSEAMGPGVEVTLEMNSMWGGNDIIVPPGVRIVDRVTSIMAGNDIASAARGDGSNGTLVLTGFSLMAGNDVKLARRG